MIVAQILMWIQMNKIKSKWSEVYATVGDFGCNNNRESESKQSKEGGGRGWRGSIVQLQAREVEKDRSERSRVRKAPYAVTANGGYGLVPCAMEAGKQILCVGMVAAVCQVMQCAQCWAYIPLWEVKWQQSRVMYYGCRRYLDWAGMENPPHSAEMS